MLVMKDKVTLFIFRYYSLTLLYIFSFFFSAAFLLFSSFFFQSLHQFLLLKIGIFNKIVIQHKCLEKCQGKRQECAKVENIRFKSKNLKHKARYQSHFQRQKAVPAQFKSSLRQVYTAEAFLVQLWSIMRHQACLPFVHQVLILMGYRILRPREFSLLLGTLVNYERISTD